MEEIDIALLEIFNTGDNHWEWLEVIRVNEDTDMDRERKEAFMNFCGYDEEEDKEFIDNNYKEETRVNYLTI